VFYLFELGWRGVFYGTIDGLAMLAFPALVAYLVLRGDRRGFGRKVAFAALTLVLVVGVTAVYHLGYQQFRGRDLKEPVTGMLVMSVPTVLTANPVGAVIAHASVHTGAVVHEYYGSDPGFLPPRLTGYEDRWGGLVGWLLASGWLMVVALFVTALAQRRERPPG
jgi:hypothetical protein